jgi:hypothetical protein
MDAAMQTQVEWESVRGLENAINLEAHLAALTGTEREIRGGSKQMVYVVLPARLSDRRDFSEGELTLKQARWLHAALGQLLAARKDA